MAELRKTFPWIKTDPREILDKPRPKTLDELAKHPYRPAYVSLFHQFMERTEAPGNKRELVAAFDTSLALLDLGVKIGPDAVQPTVRRDHPSDQRAVNVLRTFGGGVADEENWKLFKKHTADLTKEYGAYYLKMKDVKEFAKKPTNEGAITEGMRAVVKESLGDKPTEMVQICLDSTVDMKKEINRGVATIGVLGDETRMRENRWKECASVLETTVGAAMAVFGEAEGSLRLAVEGYKKKDPSFGADVLADRMLEYSKASEALAGSLESAAREAADFLRKQARKIAAENLANVLPEVSQGLLFMKTGVFIGGAALGAVGILFPPAGIAAGVLGLASMVIEKIVVGICTAEYVRDNDKVMKTLLTTFAKEGAENSPVGTAAGVVDKGSALFDAEQIGELLFNSGMDAAGRYADGLTGAAKDQLKSSLQAVGDTASTAFLATGALGVLIGAWELSSAFMEADAKSSRLEDNPELCGHFRSLLEQANGSGKPTGPSTIIRRLTSGDYRVVHNGLRGTVSSTGDFIPDGRREAFVFFRSRVPASRLQGSGDHEGGGYGREKSTVRITSAIDLDLFLPVAYDSRLAELVLTSSDANAVVHRVTHADGEDLDADERYIRRCGDLVALRLDSEGIITVDMPRDRLAGNRLGDEGPLAPPKDWVEQIVYVPWRKRYPDLLKPECALSPQHPYIRYGYVKVTASTDDRIGQLATVEQPYADEARDFAEWRLLALSALEAEYRGLGLGEHSAYITDKYLSHIETR